jgi:hypothetical protein
MKSPVVTSLLYGAPASPDEQLPANLSSNLPDRRRRTRLHPVAVLAVTCAGLSLCFEYQIGHVGFGHGQPRTVSLSEAVDISVERLTWSRVKERLGKTDRLSASMERNRLLIHNELVKIRENPLHAMITKMMTDHLRNKGFDRVSLAFTAEKEPMLSWDAEFTLNDFIHSLRASFLAPNDNVAAFLVDQEARFGKSIVDYRGAQLFDTSFPFLIQLLYEMPDDIKPIADAVTFRASGRSKGNLNHALLPP